METNEPKNEDTSSDDDFFEENEKKLQEAFGKLRLMAINRNEAESAKTQYKVMDLKYLCKRKLELENSGNGEVAAKRMQIHKDAP